MICKYSEHWGCKQDAVISGMCLPHAMLFHWFIYGPGESAERIREHDKVAGFGAPELERTLRGPIWDPRLRALAEVKP